MPRANMNRRTAHSQLLRSFEGLTEEQKVTLFMKLRYKHHQTMGELLYIARRAYAAGYEDAIEGLGFDALETARHELVAAYYADELQRISNGGMLDINGAVMLLIAAVALYSPSLAQSMKTWLTLLWALAICKSSKYTTSSRLSLTSMRRHSCGTLTLTMTRTRTLWTQLL